MRFVTLLLHTRTTFSALQIFTDFSYIQFPCKAFKIGLRSFAAYHFEKLLKPIKNNYSGGSLERVHNEAMQLADYRTICIVLMNFSMEHAGHFTYSLFTV